MWILRITPLIIALLLSSCGFRLQGMMDMPRWFNCVAIFDKNMSSDLKPIIKKRLKAYNICVCKDISKAKYWLILEEDKNSERITSVSSSTTPRQYQMTYVVRYKVQKNKGKDIIPSSDAIVTRQFTINSNRILGSDYEGDLLKKEMYYDAVTQILDHIENTKNAA